MKQAASDVQRSKVLIIFGYGPGVSDCVVPAYLQAGFKVRFCGDVIFKYTFIYIINLNVRSPWCLARPRNFCKLWKNLLLSASPKLFRYEVVEIVYQGF